jgi:glutaredoxin-related protein
MSVTLFTTHCPKCKVIEKKLAQKNIEYEMVEDINIMKEKGFKSLPMLEVDGQVFNFIEANKWVTNYTA